MKLFEDPKVDRRFNRMQWRMLFATMIGYTLFYFMRKNFSFAMPGLQQDCGISKSMLGNFLFWGGIVYGLSKFLRLAKEMGAKFSFGTNNFDARPKDLSRWLEAIVWLDLGPNDIWRTEKK